MFFSPPKFDFDSALAKLRMRHRNRILKQQKQLQGFVDQSLKNSKGSNEPPQEISTFKNEIEEFKDGTNYIQNYEYYDESSGEMAYEDYL